MDIRAQYAPMRAELDAAISDILDTGTFILGPRVKAVEEAVGKRLGNRPCVGVANGTDALVIALQALGVKPGDEVITTPYTFYATAEAIARHGATPVFVDVEPMAACIDPDLIEEKVTEKTKAIIPVHIFGHSASMTPRPRHSDRPTASGRWAPWVTSPPSRSSPPRTSRGSVTAA
jgi:dTDP-4-amino-4,6-dideoxygalactose transaminase